MNTIITKILDQQKKYIDAKNRSFLQSKSQFFTPVNVARKMIHELNLNNYTKNEVAILEPSAGFGILISILLESIIKTTNIKKIHLTIFELDENIFKILNENLIYIKNKLKNEYNIILEYTIYNDDFLLYYKDFWIQNLETKKFDIIISNPPYKKINQSDESAVIMKDIIFGQPNLYQLFIALSLKLLNKKGKYVTITPRNYLTGQYSKLLRKYIFQNFHLCSLHSFDNMNLFKEVEQEVIISTFINEMNNNQIKISNNGNFEFITKASNLIDIKNDYSVIVPKNNNDLKIYQQFKLLDMSLKDLNIKISVGPVVQFRNTKFLSKKKYFNNFAPLLISGDIQSNNLINYCERDLTIERKTNNKSINISSKKVIPNSNYLLLRKVTSKKDNQLIFPAILTKNYFKHKFIGLDNNLLYFSKTNNTEFSINELNGLYCYINSIDFEKYYSLVNGTYTINVSDFNFLKFPNFNILSSMGKDLINSNDYSKNNCNKILKNYITVNIDI